MSVLSKIEILKALNEHKLFISPILNEKAQIGSSAVDLRMGTILMVIKARGLSHVDPRDYLQTAEDSYTQACNRQKLERYDIPFKGEFLLHPGTLALVPTLEWVKLPYDLQGVVTARSSWAREGLNIATASFINPGYEGIITLELANLGQIPIALYSGLRLAQIAFYKLESAREKDVVKSQFSMKFEPVSGYLLKDDEKPFVPQRKHNTD